LDRTGRKLSYSKFVLLPRKLPRRTEGDTRNIRRDSRPPVWKRGHLNTKHWTGTSPIDIHTDRQTETE
jgi:hypothetical protein